MKISAELDYWIEIVTDSLDSNKVSATAEQIQSIANDMRISHENYGLAFYQPSCEPSYATRELETCRKELKREKEKVFCKACQGRGRIIESFGTFTSDMECSKCHGEGKHDPWA